MKEAIAPVQPGQIGLGMDAANKPSEQDTGFTDALNQAVDHVNGLQQEASAMQDAFARGEDMDLTEVMVSMQKADVGFEATKQVRNQLVEAYNDIFNMPV